MKDFVGIYRERIYSPGKVEADRAILDAVAARLRVRSTVAVLSADDPLPEIPAGATVFTMCQGPCALARLHAWAGAGHRIVNSPAAIENCHRRRMLAAFEWSGVRHPESILIDTAESGRLPSWIDRGAWVKRGDVHATEPGDVVHTAGSVATVSAVERLHRRGIEAALVQRHIDGEVIKFYAVRGRFLRAFPATPALGLDGHIANDLAELAEQGAEALGLEVFGGDCVLDRESNLWLIDLNDWPSYGPCRAEAAHAIAAYLDAADEANLT